MSGELIGEKAIIKRLSLLEERLQNKIIKRGVGRAMTVIDKGITSEIPSQWKEIRRLIGSRFNKRAGRGVISAKVGVAVGRPKGGGGEKMRLGSGRSITLAKNRRGRPGVGFGAENVHWLIFGTAERRQGTKRRGRGPRAIRVATGGRIRRTGRMPPQLPGIVPRGFRKAESKAISVMFETIRTGIDKEAAKLMQEVQTERT